MSVTQSGLCCDVCGAHIMPCFDEAFERFGVHGVEHELQCHLRCRPEVEKAVAANDWSLLPSGPLRAAFERATPQEGEERMSGDEKLVQEFCHEN